MDRRTFILLLLSVAFFAFSARAFLYNWENIFGIDSYWFARMGRYVLLYGNVPDRDPLYAWGFTHAKIDKELSMYLPAWYYHLRFGGEYNKDRWFTALKDLSASFGVLGSLASALTAWALAGPVAGVLSGVLAGTNPGYVYRTMAGFYEDDAVGLALFLLGAWLFVEGIRRRKKKWFFYVLAGVSWLGVAVAWKAYELVVYTILLFLLLLLGRKVTEHLSKTVPENMKKHLYGAAVAAVLGLLVWLIWRFLALKTAAGTLEVLGYLTTDINGVGAPSLLILGLHPLAVIFIAVFSFYLTLYLIEGNKNYLYYALGSFILSLPFYQLSATHGFTTTVLLSDGREVFIGYGEAFREVGGNVPGVNLYQMLFGTIALTFTAQVAVSFLALLFKKEEITPSKRLVEFFLASALVLLMGLIAYFYNGYNWVTDFLGGSPGLLEQRTSVVGATVVEERYGYFFWAPKYSILALFAIFAAPFLVYRSKKPEYLFLLALFGLTLYLGWIKLKTCYYFGAPLGIVAGIVLADIWERTRKSNYLRYVAFLILVIALSSVATGIYHTVGRVPTLLNDAEVNEARAIAPIASDLEWINGPEYLSAFEFIDKNTEKNAPIFNWWGVGHWLTFFTERPVATDNTNRVFEADQFVAKTFLSEWNRAYEKIKEKNFQYVFWLRDYVYAASSFAVYAYGFDEGRRVAREYTFFVTNECEKVSVGNYYNCGTKDRPFFVDADIVEGAPSIIFAPLPFQLLPKVQEKYGVYRAGSRLVIVSEKMNNSLLFLLWKGGNDKFVPVFVSRNGKVVVYKVN